MRRSFFFAVFITAHIIFIFLQIHKHALFIKQSYRKQKNEKLRNNLHSEKDSLNHQLQLLENHTSIKKYAQNKLAMVPVKLSQIKKVPHEKR